MNQLGDLLQSLHLQPQVQLRPGWWQQAFASALRSGTSEMVGLPGEWVTGITGVTPEQTAEWRDENWLASLGSQVLGALPTYIAGMTFSAPLAARALPRLFSPAAMTAKPTATTVGRAVAEIAPFEAARIATSAVMGGDLEATAASAGIDVAANVGFGLIGRFFKTLKQNPEVNRLAQALPDFPQGQSTQTQLEYLLMNVDKAPAEARPIIEGTIDSLRRDVRVERPPPGFSLDLEGVPPGRAKVVASAFNSGQRFAVSKDGFPTRADWEKALADFSPPKDWETFTQFPRLVDLSPRLAAVLKKHFTAGPDDWFIRRFADEDMFVIAKPVGGTQVKVGPTGAVPPDVAQATQTFVTEKGSRYWLYPDNTTIRDKAPRPEHPGEKGLQPRSALTVYVDPKEAQVLALPSGGPHPVGIKFDPATNILQAGQFRPTGFVPFKSSVDFPVKASLVPEVGKSPLELWKKLKGPDGSIAFTKIHLGNKITSIEPLQGSGQGPKKVFLALTTKPEAWVPDMPAVTRVNRLTGFVVKAENKALTQARANLPDDNVLRHAIELNEAIPWTRTAIPKKAGVAELFQKVLPSAAKDLAKEYSPALQKVWQDFKNIAAPEMAQFKNAPMAQQLLFKAKSVYAKALERTNKLLYGEPTTKTPLGHIARAPAAGGLRAKFEALREEDLPKLRSVIAAIEADETATAQQLLPIALKALDDPETAKRIGEFLEELLNVSRNILEHHNIVARLVGDKEITELANRVIPHIWGGNFRWRLLDERGRTVAMAWGRNADEVRQEAIRLAEKFGLTRDPRGPFVSSREEDLQLATELFRPIRRGQPRVGEPIEPKLMLPRHGVRGYMFDPEGPVLSKKELWEIIESGVAVTERRAADMAVKRLLAPKIADIAAAYGQSVANGVVQRINLMSGRQGDFGAWQNKVVERYFPGWGKNGATKLAHALNQFETHMNLLSLNLMYVMQNATTVLHTAMPEVALLRSLPIGQWRRFYDAVPVVTNEGFKGAAFIANPMKIALDAARALRKPTDVELAIFRRASRDGTIAPAFIEHEVGSKSRRVLSWQSLKEQGLWRSFLDLMELPAVKVEELTRAHALMMGARIGQAVGLKDELLYQFARQFTNRTMFGYSAADRPRLFTGPVGTMFGLFKNWTMHYLTHWGVWAGEAGRGNFAPLLWASMGVGVTAGIGGLPLIAGLEAFKRWVDNKGLMEDYYAAFGGAGEGGLADAIWFGLPAFAKVSMQANTAAPLNDPTRDITFLFNAAVVDRARRIRDLAGEAWDAWIVGGENPLKIDRVWDRIWYGLSPRTTYKAFAQVEDGALRALDNGAPIIEGVTQLEWALNALGITPTKFAIAYEANRRIMEDRRRRAQKTAEYGTQLAYAYLRDDQVALNRLFTEALIAGADMSGVAQSMGTQLRNQLVPKLIRDARTVEMLDMLESLKLM